MSYRYYLVVARVFAGERNDLIVRPPFTGWRPTHRFETGTKIESVSARLSDEMVSRGLRIPMGESADLEMCLGHSGEEPIVVGTRWLTERSNGLTTENVVTQVIAVSVEFPEESTAEDGFFNV
jgi:hypothetical protein